MTLTEPTTGVAGHYDGQLILADDPRYDTARMAWNLAFSPRPVAIVEAASIGDVVEAVGYAAGIGAKVAIQGAGHGLTVPADGAVLILTAGLDKVEIDAEAWTATVGAGVKWGAVLAAAQERGLAPLLGSSPDVGAVGYTLGGGFGWLGRKYGLSVDHVRSFTVVLADGSVVKACDDTNQDLFWALRGAGAGSLGVVVEMEIDLVPVTRVYAGNLFYPAEMAPEVFEFYSRWSEDLPDDMTSSFLLMNFPPMDEVPEPLRGHSFAMVRGCHSGDAAEAAALVDKWREWREPLIDMFGPMPFTEAASISNDPTDPMPGLSDSRWLKELNGEVLEAITDVLAPGDRPSPFIFAEIRHAGGAVARRVAGASYSSRSAERLLQTVAVVFEPEMEEDARRRIGRLWDRLSPVVADGAYLNFLEGEDRLAQTRAAFDTDTWTRLSAVKKSVDPDNRFGHGLDLTD